MGLPSVNIIFKELATSAVEQGSVGVLALVLKDESVANGVTEYVLTNIADIPAVLDAANKDYVNKAFLGVPKEIHLIVIQSDAANFSAAMNYLETIQFNVLAIPGVAPADVATFSAWTIDMFDNKERKIISVLPNSVSDHPAVINFSTDNIVVGATTYTTSQYTARIAGIIAGLALTQSPTFQVLSEVTDVPKLSKSDADTLINAGKLILYHDGEKVKIGRGVTSRTTVNTTFGADWKKIKIVRILNKTYDDIKRTIEDLYVGKVQNNYINKLLLVSAIKAYYEQLEEDEILDSGKNSADIDVTAQRIYLKTIMDPVEVNKMTDQQIREANTRDQVFLVATQRPLDAIEDVKLTVSL
jgi:hypothetical protein